MSQGDSSQRHSFLILFLFMVLLISTPACQRQSRETETPSPEVEVGLTLNNASLEQANEEGETVWKIQAQRAFYSKDKETADLEKITGNLYSNGEIVIQVSAEKGKILENGKKVVLQEKIVAIDPRNEAVFRANELEWIPDDDLVIVRGDLQGEHPNLQATANEGKYLTSIQQMELFGGIVATAKEPPLQLKGEHFVWEIPQETVKSDQPLTVNRYEGDTITEQVSANTAEVDLASKTVVLRGNATLKSINPSVNIQSATAIWNVEGETVTLDESVQIVHTTEKIVLTGNRGQVDLNNEIARLNGTVQAINNQNNAQLNANQLTWEIPTQEIRAEGNVVYQQQSDPPLTLRGTTATGKLGDDKIIVTGGGNASTEDRRVVIEIIP